MISPNRDLKGALSFFEQKGELIRLRRKVKQEFELAALVQNVQATANKVVWFENVEGFKGSVVSNVCGTHERIAHMLSCEAGSVAATWASKFEKFPKLDYELCPEDSSERVELSLGDLPTLKFHEKDGGPYITAGIFAVRNLETGSLNLSYHRVQLTGTDEWGVRLARGSGHLLTQQKIFEAQGKPLECAILIGTSPLLMLTASTTMSSRESELDLACALAGETWRLNPCRTIDLAVPEGCEIVIEGEILPNVKRMEGPFGEWMGSYAAAAPQHVFRVKGIHGRRNPIYSAIIPGSPEDILLQGVPISGSIFKAIRTFVPSVLDVVCWPMLRFCVIKMRKQATGEERKALLAALGAELNRILYAVVVDEDVNIHDPVDLIWAISTRCRPDRDIFIIPEVPSSSRDPFQRHWGRVGIDATVPQELVKEFERKRIPGSEGVRWEDYI